MSMIGNLLRVTIYELEDYLRNSSLLEDRIYSEENLPDPNLLDLDKAWEGIFYLLNGFDFVNNDDAQLPQVWPLFGGQYIDEEQDLGYGPANYSTPEKVKTFTIVLNDISSEEFHQRFTKSNMEEELGIYSGYEYLLETFEKMKDFYTKASNEGQAVISFIS